MRDFAKEDQLFEERRVAVRAAARLEFVLEDLPRNPKYWTRQRLIEKIGEIHAELSPGLGLTSCLITPATHDEGGAV